MVRMQCVRGVVPLDYERKLAACSGNTTRVWSKIHLSNQESGSALSMTTRVHHDVLMRGICARVHVHRCFARCQVRSGTSNPKPVQRHLADQSEQVRSKDARGRFTG